MKALKYVWSQVKALPLWVQIPLWGVLGGAVVVALQECGAF